MKVPQGFKRYYPGNVVLQLMKTIYGLIQAALAFWRKLVLAFLSILFQSSKADPFLFFKWTNQGLVMWISFIDDMCGSGQKDALIQSEIDDIKKFVNTCNLNIDV
jgi:hypothetical protein